MLFAIMGVDAFDSISGQAGVYFALPARDRSSRLSLREYDSDRGRRCDSALPATSLCFSIDR
jgi:hypothetical protein